jgi:hypothetical protein
VSKKSFTVAASVRSFGIVRMATQTGYKTLLGMGFAKPCSPGEANQRLKADLEQIEKQMRAEEEAKAASKALQQATKRPPGRPRKIFTVNQLLGAKTAPNKEAAVTEGSSTVDELQFGMGLRSGRRLSQDGIEGCPIQLDAEDKLELGVEGPNLGAGGKRVTDGAEGDGPPKKKVRRYVNWFIKDLWPAIEKILKETNFNTGEMVKLLKMRHLNPIPGQQYNGVIYENLSRQTVDSWMKTTFGGKKVPKDDVIYTVEEMRRLETSAQFKGRMSLNRGNKKALEGQAELERGALSSWYKGCETAVNQ